jgi:Undecaprenyl-phosphate galactose phosphotransferase WbaP
MSNAPIRRPFWAAVAPFLVLAIGDLLAIAGANHLALLIKSHWDHQLPLHDHVALWPLLSVFLIVFSWLGLYRAAGLAPAHELRVLVRGTVGVYLLAASAAYLVRSDETLSRGALLLGAILSMGFLVTIRTAIRAWFSRFPWWGRPVVILGAGLTGDLIVKNLLRQRYLGWRPRAIFDDDPARHGTTLHGIPVVGALDQAGPLARQQSIDTAIVAMPGASIERLRELELANQRTFPNLILLPNFCAYASMWVQPCDFGGILGLHIQRNLLHPWPRLCKRFTDLALCLFGSLFVLPLTALLVVLIRLESPGPAFYSQERIGRDGRRFRAWKFRSMIANAEAVLQDYLAAHPELRDEWERDHKLRNDPRVTRVGRFLRKTSLDELPQLWNVWIGQMSLVGPRPIVAAEIPKYRDLFGLYTEVRPGITGLWQVSGRNDTTYDERVNLDASYVRNWSVWLDLWILIRTIRVVLLGKGAY